MLRDFPIAQLDYSFDVNRVTQWLLSGSLWFQHVEINPHLVTAFPAQPDSAYAVGRGVFVWRLGRPGR